MRVNMSFSWARMARARARWSNTSRPVAPCSGPGAAGGHRHADARASALAWRTAMWPRIRITRSSTPRWKRRGFALRHLGFSERQARATVDESLAAMGLSDVRDRHPLALPRGDRARVVVATILAMAPEVIIFDEPTTGQDYRGAQAIPPSAGGFMNRARRSS